MGTKMVRVRGWAERRWRDRLAERRRVRRSAILSLGRDLSAGISWDAKGSVSRMGSRWINSNPPR